MQRNRRILLALSFTALLLPGLSFTSFGANEPVLNPGAKDAAGQGALSISLYLTDALHLTQAQAQAVRECTRHELEQLATTPGAASPADAPLQVQKEYELAMARILNPEQYRAFQQLERGPLVISTVSRVLAAR
ncbi:hypothetical protein LJ737_09550 [Hymenobacter sp. 15J16-1T3B]|uniref:hypothetical protein n=1 Tax=Hymenobacter sp. 15J16-1T3B TaxID=2886941 RepID=UPI001D10FCB9|nr:hypothetical protein [Hymenobacter sp. 15J16-1T3B]MCC3157484.1 hypothetical protein [Hymenobacter sp. 15J16-1T3B]